MSLVTTGSVFAGAYWMALGDIHQGRPERTTREIVETMEEWAERPITQAETAAACEGYGDGWRGDDWRLNRIPADDRGRLQGGPQ